ncbi:MAG TPA: hypothetical protein VNB06_16255 [Thermoanaerobaculia bacterium]|nr:hypothetical protein [Thermoanaerobaculia bacterium]
MPAQLPNPVVQARVAFAAILLLVSFAAGALAQAPFVDREVTIMGAGPRPSSPSVDVGPDGDPAVFWMQDGGDGTIICLQRLAASGQSRTGPLIANVSGGLNGSPTGRVLPDGTLLTFWSLQQGTVVKAPDGKVLLAASQGSSVLGRRFDPNGAPIGGEIVVSQGGEGESARPAAATDVDGNTVVVWEDSGNLFARGYDALGSPLTSERGVNDRAPGGARAPAIAKAPSGEVIVAWRQLSGPQVGIFVRVLNANLQPFGQSVRVANLVNALAPSLAVDRNGGFAIAWEERGIEGRDVFVRRYGRRAQPRSETIQINPTSAGDQTRPRIEFDAAGRLIVAWESTTTPAAGGSPNAATVNGGSVVGRVFDPNLLPTSEEFVIAESESGTEPAAPAVTVDDQGQATVAYQKESTADGSSKGLFRKRVILPSGGACSPSGTRLCLNGGRFGVEVDFDPPTAPKSAAGAVPLTGDTGYFWFFEQENVEIVVKVLEACAINGKRWVFAAGLTDVALTLEVTDAPTGAKFTFDHPGGALPPLLNVNAFDCGAGAITEPSEVAAAADAAWAELASELAVLEAVRQEADLRIGTFAAAPCNPSATRLCLNASRFEVEASFREPGGPRTDAESVKLTSDTGYFWFFDEENVEVVVKVLDACAINNRYWVFAGGLTDVDVELEVRDSVTGKSVTYRNSQGQPFAQIRDTSAIDACP